MVFVLRVMCHESAQLSGFFPPVLSTKAHVPLLLAWQNFEALPIYCTSPSLLPSKQ